MFSKESVGETFSYLGKMDLATFGEKWFEMHNLVGDLSASGLQYRRVVSILINFDPLSIDVNKFL